MLKPPNITARRTALAAVALNLLLGLPPSGAAHAADGPCPGSFTTIVSCVVTYVPYTGSAQTWTVPSGVSSVTFDLLGAQGAQTGNLPGGNPGGGLGGEATATVAVTAGQTFQINVGGQGGFNGGGSGANKGGGATDVRSGGFTLNERLIVAGGGGGQGSSGGQGGAGGGASGSSGNNPSNSVRVGALSGPSGGGSQTGGGSGGFGDTDGGNGGLAVGGNGGTSSGQTGGGGGGGYYGGGGGSAGNSGASYGGGGAGGSGFGPAGVSFKNGVRGGNGLVVITYWPPTASSTAGIAPPATAPVVSFFAQNAPFGTKWAANTLVRYAITFVTPKGETDVGPCGPWGGSGYALGYLVHIPTDPSGQASARNIYRQFQNGTPELIGTLTDNTTTEYQDENF